ncbi:MAG: DUF1553 domain-containing protein [Pirellulales bacterium]|nr:DUF1553 domain-containing protein [Pirellulales bacterium]
MPLHNLICVRSGLVVVSIWLLGGMHHDASADDWDAARFDRQMAPLLARNCLECHNPADKKGELDLTSRAAALAGGESSPALAPGDTAGSYLWQRVADGEMPPRGPLPEAGKQLLREWIEAGAPWGTDPIDRFRYTTDRRAGYDWWSLQPIASHALPAVTDVQWPLNAIDHFVLARLERAGLTPSPPASRAVLLRRLYFDLVGLPPSPEEIAAFEADTDPAAYNNLVSRLLDSPRYGERWARHWLDVVRFAESNGFEYDEPRRDAWPYRDWVIDALNDDLPFDEFGRLQIAGDVLQPESPAAITAAAFLVAGPYDTPGQKQQSAAMRAIVRQDEMEDLVGTVAQSFLGLTLNCARCHDHKFDPLRQQEYYRFVSALSGVRHGQRDITSAAERTRRGEQVAAARADVERLLADIEAIDAPVRRQLAGDKKQARDERPRPIARWDFDDQTDALGGLAIKTHGAAQLCDGALVLDGQTGYAATVPLARDLCAKTLQAWVRLADLEQRGGAAISIQSLDGQTFDALVFAEQQPGEWLAGSNNFVRTQSFAGAAETAAGNRAVRITITYAADGTITAYRDGQPYGRAYRAAEPVTFAAGQAQVVLGLRHSPAGGNRLLKGEILQAELYDRALSAAEVATAGEEVSAAAILAQLDVETAKRRTRLVEQLAVARRKLELPAPSMLYACTPEQPEVTHLLRRGDTRLPAEAVSAGGVAAVPGPASDFGLPPDAPEAARRVALARWITHRDNPLFARVVVNRIWHHHFGVGLVDTPNDFGFNGGRPSHAELLDWLAVEIANRGFRLKELHRLLVTSATYRQASMSRADAVAIDRENRLLWRRTPQRLEAEALRDAMLAAAGRLQHTGGGPGFTDYQELNRSGTWSYLPADRAGPEFERRTIYRTSTRGGRGGLLDAFDCPDPSTTTPRRAVTTTPLQALALLNNAFVLRMSEALAERVEREAGAETATQVARAMELVYGRVPRADEAHLACELVEREGLATLARVLFNSNEFLYVD